MDQVRLERLSDVTVPRVSSKALEALLVPYSSLGKIPWPKPIFVATSKHPNTHVHHGFRLAAPLYVAVPDVAHSRVPVSLQVSAGCQRQGCARNCNSVPAKTSSRSSHATCCAASLAFHSLLRRSCRHLECTFLRSPGLHPTRTLPRPPTVCALAFFVAQHVSPSHRSRQSVQVLVAPEPFNFSTT